MSRRVRFSERPSPSSSAQSSSNVSTPRRLSLPSPLRHEVYLERSQFLEWLKGFGLEGKDVPEHLLGKMCRGPFKDFLAGFCLPYVRPTAWVTTMRSNLDLIAIRRFMADETRENNLAKVTAEIEECKKELEELERTEQELFEKLSAELTPLEESEIQACIQPMEAKIKKKGEKLYLESLLRSADLRSKFFQELSSVNSKAVDGSKILEVCEREEDLEQLTNVDSIQELSSRLCHLIPKFIGDEGNVSVNEDLVDNIKKLKQIVLKALMKHNAAQAEGVDVDEQFYELMDISPTAVSKLPAYEFAAGLNEFNKIIWKKLLEWSEAHITFFDKNLVDFADFAESFTQSDCLEKSFYYTCLDALPDYDFMDETAYLTLLIKEEKAREKLRFYQHINIDAYENLTRATSSYFPGRLDHSSEPPDFPKPALPNYEILTEKLLNSLPSVREGIEEGVNSTKKNFEIRQCFEEAVTLVTEELQPPDC